MQALNVESIQPRLIRKNLIEEKAKAEVFQTFHLNRLSLKTKEWRPLEEFEVKTSQKDISTICFSKQLSQLTTGEILEDEDDIYQKNPKLSNNKVFGMGESDKVLILDTNKEKQFLKNLYCAFVYRDKKHKDMSKLNVYLTTLPHQQNKKIVKNLEISMVNQKSSSFIDYQQNEMKIVVLPESKKAKASSNTKIMVTYGLNGKKCNIFSVNQVGKFTAIEEKD